jgi:DNA polymerase-3 subunit gamma/tau
MALYNKYRPLSLDMIVGQDAVKRVLRGQIKRKEISHSYLYIGGAGTGKTTVARIFSAMLCDESGLVMTPNPDGENAKQIFSGRSGIDVTEIDAASNRGIENAREIKKSADYPPISMRYKIWIIDECHALTNEAWQAMLKVIEEPPSHVVFIFCTTESDRVPDTIKTRCTTLAFHELTTPEILVSLKAIAEKEGYKASEDVLKMVASSAKGSMRQAINSLEHVFSSGEEVTPESVSSQLGVPTVDAAREFVASVARKDFVAGLTASSSVITVGVRIEDFIALVAECIHDVMCSTSKSFDVSSYGYTERDMEVFRQINASCASFLGEGGWKIKQVMRKWVDTVNWASKLVVYNTQPQNQLDVLWIAMLDDIVQIKENIKTPSLPKT